MVNENVLESDFEPLCDGTHKASLTSRSQTSGGDLTSHCNNNLLRIVIIINIILLDQASLIYDGGPKVSLKWWSDIWKSDFTIWAFAYSLPPPPHHILKMSPAPLTDSNKKSP